MPILNILLKSARYIFYFPYEGDLLFIPKTKSPELSKDNFKQYEPGLSHMVNKHSTTRAFPRFLSMLCWHSFSNSFLSSLTFLLCIVLYYSSTESQKIASSNLVKDYYLQVSWKCFPLWSCFTAEKFDIKSPGSFCYIFLT